MGTVEQNVPPAGPGEMAVDAQQARRGVRCGSGCGAIV